MKRAKKSESHEEKVIRVERQREEEKTELRSTQQKKSTRQKKKKKIETWQEKTKQRERSNNKQCNQIVLFPFIFLVLHAREGLVDETSALQCIKKSK